MAPLEVELSPIASRRHCRYCIFHFSNAPLLFHFSNAKCPVIVSFLQSSSLLFHFINRHRYCFSFFQSPSLLFHFSIDRYCFSFSSIVPFSFLFHFLNRLVFVSNFFNRPNFLAAVGLKPRTSYIFLPLKKLFRRCRGLNPGLHSQSCLWCIYCRTALMQT